jgi:flagellar motor switch protein FliG
MKASSMSKAELRKAAVLLSSLDKSQAAGLLARLEPREREAVAAEMREVESVTTQEQASVLVDFAEARAMQGAWPIEPTETNRDGALGFGGHAGGIERRAINARPFAFLDGVECQTLVGLLIDERPQTIALVASRVPSEYGARLIAGLDEEQRSAVIRAIASMEPVDSDVVAAVAYALEERVCALV